VGTGQCIETFRGPNDEVLDATFNSTGNKLAIASADNIARVYNVFTGACTALLQGHTNPNGAEAEEGEGDQFNPAKQTNEISKIQFNP
jgi:WD40 repeat protein